MRKMYSKPQLLEAVEQEAKVNGLKAFENIVDKDGHKRFIEGEISLHSDMPSGVSKTYGKWSLSGTHLMIVLCLSIENTTTLSNGTNIGTCTLPSWISDKIYPVWQSLWIERKDFSAFADDWTAQTFTCSMRKGADNTLLIAKTGNLTLTSDKNVRIYFDLLIDNE